MALASGMKAIVEEIRMTRETRKERLNEIRGETRILRDTSRELALGISVCRGRSSAKLRTSLSADVARLRDDTTKLIRGFAHARHAAGAREHADRLSEVQRIRQETSDELGKTGEQVLSLGKSRKEACVMLAAELARERRRMAIETAGLISEYATSRKRTSEALRDDLRKYGRAVQVGTQELLGGVRDSREKVRSDLRVTAEIWRSSQRKDLKRATTGQAQAVQSSTGQTDASERTGPAPGESVDLETRALTIVRQNPTGLSLAEVADKIGVHSVALGRPIKNLLERSAVRKEDKLYFPVSNVTGDM